MVEEQPTNVLLIKIAARSFDGDAFIIFLLLPLKPNSLSITLKHEFAIVIKALSEKLN
ncbi:hypothetical protein THIOSC15_2460003 [uncultured Thiomicrorhabdus sp.]